MPVIPITTIMRSEKAEINRLRLQLQTLKLLLKERDAELLRLNELLSFEKQANEGAVIADGKRVPIRVARWMNEYGMPWECFYCYEHERWAVELDPAFPYYMDNRCGLCP